MKRLLSLVLGASAIFAGCSHKATAPESASAQGAAHAPWSANAVIYEVNTRQYTDSGTFSEFARHIPRLAELGVDILWFMPIHPISELNRKGELGSYYAVADYKGVNPEFGNLDDFRAVVDSAHAAGMKVIIDWVPNHTGCDNPWVTEHPEYYRLDDDDGQMYGPFDWTDVYQLDYSKPELRLAMIDAMQYWIREAGIDGFRCDVAGMVPVDFWNAARDSIQSAAGERPVFMLAEATEPELTEHAFDMAYNWPMKDLFSEIAATSGQYTFAKEGEQPRTFPVKTAAAIDSLINLQSTQYPADAFLMNMTSNHDLNSWEGTEFERLGNLTRAMAVLTYTLPGMPLIYTGQETGLNRALEFFEKDMPPTWTPRNDYFEFYQKLNHLKHTHPALRAGSSGADMKRYPTASDDIYVFSRKDDGGATIYVFANLGKSDAEVKYTGEAPAKDITAVNFFTGRTDEFPTTLSPGEYHIYVSR